MNYQIESMKTLVNLENQSIGNLLKQLYEFEENIDGRNITADERQTVSMFRSIADKLEDVKNLIEYYRKPISHEGRMKLKENGRYSLDGVELTCGSTIEILVRAYGDEEIYEWLTTRIDTTYGKYYAVGRYGEKLEGAIARMR